MVVKADKWIGQYIIGDPDDECINPASLDLRLGGHMIMRVSDDKELLDSRNTEWNLPDGQQILLEPGAQWLLCTEKAFMPVDKAGLFTLKSSMGRRGLFLAHPGWIDPGYEGAITFSVSVQVPVVMTVGERVGQLIYFDSEIPRKPYGEVGHYQDSIGVTEERCDGEEEDS